MLHCSKWGSFHQPIKVSLVCCICSFRFGVVGIGDGLFRNLSFTIGFPCARTFCCCWYVRRLDCIYIHIYAYFERVPHYLFTNLICLISCSHIVSVCVCVLSCIIDIAFHSVVISLYGSKARVREYDFICTYSILEHALANA